MVHTTSAVKASFYTAIFFVSEGNPGLTSLTSFRLKSRNVTRTLHVNVQKINVFYGSKTLSAKRTLEPVGVR